MENNKTKKTIFEFDVSNVINLITNSSSELFILQGKTKEYVTEMIKSVYHDYLDEYDEVLRIDELDNDQLTTYVGRNYNSWSNAAQKNLYNLIPGFTFDEMYEESNWGKTKEYYPKDVTDETREKYIRGISPKKDIYFLFSKNDNPNWEKQEELMTIASRYYLG